MAGGTDTDLAAHARIRNAALDGFARDGVAGTSIRGVARAAGVSPGLVQHHFPTKQALRAAVNEHVLTRARAAFSELPEVERPDQLWPALGDRITAFVETNSSELRYVARAAIEGDEAALRMVDAFVGIAHAQLDRLAAAGMLREDLDRTWAALHVTIVNLATVLLADAVGRHLPAPFLDRAQLERWNQATTALFRQGQEAGGRR